MPHIIEMDSPVGKQRLWNVNAKTGYLGQTQGLDVKLIQFFLYAVTDPKGDVFKITSVTGQWSGWTASVLRMFEEETDASPDGCVDPVRPGQAYGTRSKRLYKILSLQLYYLKRELGFSTLPGFLAASHTVQELDEVLMKMPENNPEMPKDLQEALIRCRDQSIIEF